jgi:hypothetical protein
VPPASGVAVILKSGFDAGATTARTMVTPFLLAECTYDRTLEPRMLHRTSVMLALTGALACASGSTEATSIAPGPDLFAGSWQSTTPSLEFVRLSITSLSSEQGALGVRLTFSGVAWEGRGRIEGDSLVVPVALLGGTQPSGTLVARVREGQSLAARLRADGAASPLDLTLVRER